MKNFIVYFICFFWMPFGFSQTAKVINASEYKITKTVPNKADSKNTVLNITFECDINYGCPQDIKLIRKNKIVEVKLKADQTFSYLLKPGKFPLEFTAKNCIPVVTDSIRFMAGTKVYITVQLKYEGVTTAPAKPVIYLYPAQKQEVNVQFNFFGKTTFTYPEYTEGGWNVTANTNATIEHLGKEYNYLFWEGEMDASLLKINTQFGSIVTKEDLVGFFERSLASIGLNSKEIQDFITFWVPKMHVNEANYIQFLVNNDYDRVSTLEINPKPDNALRVYMVWSEFNGFHTSDPVLLQQSFTPIKREGFTVVEWGGSEVKGLINDL